MAQRPDGRPARGVAGWLGRIWIFHVVCFSWILFRGGRVETVAAIWQGLAAWRSAVPEVTLWRAGSAGMLAIWLATQLLDGGRWQRVARRMAGWPAWALGAAAAVVLTVILALGPEGVAPFIYFQF